MIVSIRMPHGAKRVEVLTKSNSWPGIAPGQTECRVYSQQEFEVRRGLFGRRRLVLVDERKIGQW